jgi:hypothetical protein
MKRLIVLALALSGCTMFRPRGGGGVSEGMAFADSFRCAERVVSDMGYSVVTRDGSREFLRASRVLDRSESGSDQVTRGYLSVSVDRDRGTERLRAAPERFVDGQRGFGGLPDPREAFPPRGPMPRDTTDVIRRGRTPRTGPRRIDPGPVATDARRVVQQCSRGRAVTAE